MEKEKRIKFSDYFKKSIDLLYATKVDFLVIGGMAISVWGNIRLTEDLDLIIFVPRTGITPLLGNAKKMGFSFDEEKTLKNAKNIGVFKIFYGNYHLDFLIASTKLESESLKRKINVEIYGKAAFVPSKEDLLLLKVIPGRPKDIIDAESIGIKQKGKLDEKYLIEWAQELSDEAEDLRIYNEVRRILKL